MADPWLKFYTSDWRSDPALRICSLAARGLWAELICLMHEATPYGHLLVNGLSPTDAQLAVLIGSPSDEITALLGELDSAGVFSRTRTGVVYSRKLTRMAKKAATARNNGRKGGNPTLGKYTENSLLDKGKVKGGLKPQNQKPEPDIERETPLVSQEIQSEPVLSIDASKKKPRRAIALPSDWVPSEKNISDAAARQFTDQEINHEADRFRDHHLARGTTFKDWDAAWRTWIGNARKFADRSMARGPFSAAGGQGNTIASIVARRRLDGAP